MNLKINRWRGGLGNNIMQIRNAIQVALYYDYNIILPKHSYFTTTYIKINNKNNIETITDGKNFFYTSKIKNIDHKLFNDNVDKTIQILKNIFKIKNVPRLDDNDVVIHIRSGDIFKVPPGHSGYIMPPLLYYENIINNNVFNKIFLIAEDDKNPVINKLLDLYPNINFKQQNLDTDIKILLGSKNVIESFGTFTSGLLLLSNYIKNIYKPSYQESSLLLLSKTNQVNIYDTDLDDYRKKIYPWKNTQKQQELMLNN